MTDDTRLNDLIADRDRGASAIARDLVAALLSLDPDAAREAARGFAHARPAFACGHRLARALREASDPTAVLRAESEHLALAPAAIAARAACRLPLGGTIATLSFSDAVRATVIAAHEAGRAPVVLVGESRPRGEGRLLAQQLARSGVRVTLVADAALPGLLDERATVLLGTDRLTEDEAVCKIGGYALALAAHRMRRPTIVLADSHKVLPRAMAPVVLEEHAPGELGDRLDGVDVRNVYFELIPARLISRIVTENRVWTRGDLRRVALRLPRRFARTTT